MSTVTIVMESGVTRRMPSVHSAMQQLHAKHFALTTDDNGLRVVVTGDDGPVATIYRHRQGGTCQCCGGSLPAREVWYETRHHDGEDCDGAVNEDGRCNAAADDECWYLAE